MIELFVILGFCVFYVVLVLGLEELTQDDLDESGLLVDKKKIVVNIVQFDESSYVKYTRYVDFFDRFRALFGVYEREAAVEEDVDEYWYINKKRSGVWECPFCLSFWVASLFSLLSVIYGVELKFIPIFIFGLSGLSSLLHVIFGYMTKTVIRINLYREDIDGGEGKEET